MTKEIYYLCNWKNSVFMDSINVLTLVCHVDTFIKETMDNILNRSFGGFDCRRVWQIYDNNSAVPKTNPPT
jgi:hypothetical protein